MSNLEYADPTVKTPPNWWMRRLPLFAIICLVLSACVLFLVYRHNRTPAPHPVIPSSTYTIDFSVPGTEVYMEGMLLGKVPLQLSIERRRELGLTASPPDAMQVLETDEWGEHIILRDRDGSEHALMLKVPDGDAARCLDIETPWGRRTRFQGSTFSVRDHRWSSGPAPYSNRGIALHIVAPKNISPATINSTIPVTVTVQNVTSDDFVGKSACLRPHSTGEPPSTPWRNRASQIFELPPVFSHIPAAAVLATTLRIPTPSIAADYNIFPAFGIVQKDGRMLGNANVYGNSILVRVTSSVPRNGLPP